MTAKRDKLYRSTPTPHRCPPALLRPASDFGLERLEDRKLLSASLSLDANGVLTLVGTEQQDYIMVFRDSQDPSKLWTSYGLVNLADVRGVRIEGLGGDDFLSVLLNNPWSPRSSFTGNPADDYTTFDIPVTINGGDGDDELTSESSADDLLVGGAGYDRTSAFAGNDLFSAEWMEDYSPEHQPTLGADYNTFWWDDAGDQVFRNPWDIPVPQGWYSGVGHAAPSHSPAPDGQSHQMVAPAPPNQSNDTAKPVIDTALAQSSVAEAPVQPAPPVVFSALKIDPKHDGVWDDLAA